MCGIWLWGIGFLIVAGVLSIIPGLAAYLLARRKKARVKEIAAALATVGAFLLMVFGCIVYYEWCSSNFYCDGGFDDYYRIPLKYPYQISAYGDLDTGCLDIWQGDGSCILRGITHYAANDSVMVGRIGSSCPDCPEKWFSFSFDTQEYRYYDSEKVSIAACKALGFVREPELISIHEHYYED